MRLRVKETNGRLHTVEADPQIQFDRFREMVHKLVPGIAPDMQKLVFDGRLLDADTLKATGLKDGGAALVPFSLHLLLLASDLSFLHLHEPSLPSRRPYRHLGTSSRVS